MGQLRPGWQWGQIGGAAAGACQAGGAGRVPAEPPEGLWWDAGAVEHLLLSLVFRELCVCCGRDRVDF